MGYFSQIFVNKVSCFSYLKTRVLESVCIWSKHIYMYLFIYLFKNVGSKTYKPRKTTPAQYLGYVHFFEHACFAQRSAQIPINHQNIHLILKSAKGIVVTKSINVKSGTCPVYIAKSSSASYVSGELNLRFTTAHARINTQ